MLITQCRTPYLFTAALISVNNFAIIVESIFQNPDTAAHRCSINTYC